jgi:hypothetical protein
MNPRSRIDKLLSRVRGLLPRNRPSYCVAGLTTDDFVTACERACPAEVRDLHDELWEQILEAEKRGDDSGFGIWIDCLIQGWSYLPRTIPPALIRAWSNGTKKHLAGERPGQPMPGPRCRDCLVMFPNCDESGATVSRFLSCPVCGSGRWEWMNLWKPGTFTPC